MGKWAREKEEFKSLCTPESLQSQNRGEGEGGGSAEPVEDVGYSGCNLQCCGWELVCQRIPNVNVKKNKEGRYIIADPDTDIEERSVKVYPSDAVIDDADSKKTVVEMKMMRTIIPMGDVVNVSGLGTEPMTTIAGEGTQTECSSTKVLMLPKYDEMAVVGSGGEEVLL